MDICLGKKIVGGYSHDNVEHVILNLVVIINHWIWKNNCTKELYMYGMIKNWTNTLIIQ